jgi:flagellar basal-body rod modification protein FlgD
MTSAVGDTLSSLGLPVPKTADDGRLSQQHFLELMTTQLKNQDPFKPLDSGDFLGQLAQFGTVSGINDLQTSFSQLSSELVSNQTMQAAQLVGRRVLLESPSAYFDGSTAVEGAVDLGADSSALRVQIRDGSGRLVRQLDLGAQSAGLANFKWDGTTDDGGIAPPGVYSVTAQYRDGGEMESGDTLVRGAVESVSIGQQGLSLEVRGLGELPFDAVREIG